MLIKKSKGFTMIEVLTVIALLGIIVLLAAPRFLSYIEVAKLAQIKNDVKAHENHIESKLSIHSNFVDDWDFISNQELEGLRGNTKLYDRTGLIEKTENVTFTQENKIIPKKIINTKLKGIFIFDSNGKVYYYDGKIEATERLACEDAELQGYICIYTIEDLRRISHNMSAKYILMNDLDLSSIENWQPIGHETGNVISFTGEFNGNNYSINNLTINNSEPDLYSYALFSDTENGMFKNITMKDSSITLGGDAYGPAAYISPLVGRSLESGLFEDISIENFKVSADLTFVGGVTGKSENTEFKNISINNSESIGSSQAGGVAGISENSEFKNISIDDIEIVGDWAVGGVTGNSINSSYENISVSNSNISSKSNNSGSHIGGIIGNSSSNSLIKEVKIINSHVKGVSLIGGIVGSINTTSGDYGTHKISQSEVQGKVEGTNGHVGGIIGASSGHLEVEKVKVNVEMLGNKYIGGIVGSLNSINDKGSYHLKDMEIHTTIKNHPLAHSLSFGDEMFNSGGIIGEVTIDDEFDLTINKAKVSGEIHTIKNSGGVIGHFREARYSYLNPNPTPKTMYLEDVSSSINFIETLKDPENRGEDGYYSIGGIVGSLPDIGSGKLNLKNVYYDGDMNISNFYEVTENKPVQAVVWRNISPIVSLSQMNYNFEEYIQNWNSIVETENVYWIKENSPGLEPFDLLNLGK